MEIESGPTLCVFGMLCDSVNKCNKCSSSRIISPVCLFIACVFVAVSLRNAFHKVGVSVFQSTEMN